MSKTYLTLVTKSEYDALAKRAEQLAETWLSGDHDQVLTICLTDARLVAGVALHLYRSATSEPNSLYFLREIEDHILRS